MDGKQFEIDRKDLIEGLGKGLRVIESFDDEHPRLTASETAPRAGITRTAARRYLLSLAHFGYAATDGKQFWLVPRVLRLGQSYLAAERLPRLVQPIAQRVAAQTGETVNFSVLRGHEVQHLVLTNPPRYVSLGYPVGASMPAHLPISGIAMLASWAPAELETWLEGHDFSAGDGAAAVDPAAFREMIAKARGQGYAAGWQQFDPGLRGIAVALTDRSGALCGALGITVAAASLGDTALVDKLLSPLQEAAASLQPLI